MGTSSAAVSRKESRRQVRGGDGRGVKITPELPAEVSVSADG